jgi:VWFA-related protein
MRDSARRTFRRFGPGAAFVLAAAAFGRQLAHEVRVVNIEVPVRVFKGTAFVDNLKVEDFEVFENGVRQVVDGVYLVRKASVERREGAPGRAPSVRRTFVLLFEMTEFQAELERSLAFFFENVLLPEDELIVFTPMKSYTMKRETLAKLTRAETRDQLLGKLRRDILQGSSEYLGLIRELGKVMGGAASVEEKLMAYRQTLDRLESLREVDEKGLLEFARLLKSRDGQKIAFLFYQKEVVPKIDYRELMTMMNDPETTFTYLELFDFHKRDARFNVEAVKRAFSDSSISVHFLFITKTSPLRTEITAQNPTGMDLVEQSEDIYSAFREIAAATGGLTDSSFRADTAFRRAVDAAETYYLVYYKPADARADGTFRTITVKVKGGGLSVSHRAGYFAH